MSNQKGVTLMSLIIYIIVLTIIISILAFVSQMFFTNMKFITEKGKYVSEFNKFNMYFIKDVKNNKDILEVKTDGKQITFLDGTIYTFKPKENSIYRNKVKICNNIANCTFSVSDTNPEETGGITKKIAIVNMLIKGTKDLKSTNEYVLRYW